MELSAVSSFFSQLVKLEEKDSGIGIHQWLIDIGFADRLLDLFGAEHSVHHPDGGLSLFTSICLTLL